MSEEHFQLSRDLIDIADEANENDQPEECLDAATTACRVAYEGYGPEQRRAFRMGLCYAATLIGQKGDIQSCNELSRESSRMKEAYP